VSAAALIGQDFQTLLRKHQGIEKGSKHDNDPRQVEEEVGPASAATTVACAVILAGE
jgi:hypothetical protein